MYLLTSTLHVYTLIFPAIILKVVSFHDFPIRAAWASHSLLCQAQVALRGKSWMETIFKIIARRINVSICNVLTSYLHVYCSAQWNYFRNRQSSIDRENLLPFEIFPTTFDILRETSFDIIFKKFALTKKGITILL